MVCKLKSGLTRHISAIHNDVVAEAPTPKKENFSIEIVSKEIEKCVQKISTSELYNAKMRDEAKLITAQKINLETLIEMINKLNIKTDEKFTTQFFGKIVMNSSEYIKTENRQLGVLLFSKLCTSLLAQKKVVVQQKVSIAREINTRELAGLQYLGGFILRHSYANLRKSKNWSSEKYQNMMAVIKSCQDLEKPTNQKLVAALDRSGLWYIKERFQEIIVKMETIFCSTIKNRKDVRKIEKKSIIDELLNNQELLARFQSLADECDREINDECLEGVMKQITDLFVRMRSYNFAKDTVQRFKLQNTSVKKPLRKTLKDICNIDNENMIKTN